MNKIKTIEELEKDLKVLYAKYYQAIEKTKQSLHDLESLLSDLSMKNDEALSRQDLIKVIRANCAYMNVLSLTRYLLANIRSLRRFIQALRNTDAK